MKKILALFLSFVSLSLTAQNMDTLDFETTDTLVVIDTSQTNNIWQKGTPSKSHFNSAYSGYRAIVTDTLNSYPINNISSFTLGFTLYGGQPNISFNHRFDTDSLHDGGYVEISNDSGKTWLLLADTTFLDGVNHYFYSRHGLETSNFYGVNDSLPGGKIGFSGQSRNWIFSVISFPCYAWKKPFELMLRFTFVSDSISENRDGWMIDQIIIDNTGECSSLDEQNLLPQLEAYPNPANTTARVDLPSGIYLRKGRCEIRNLTGQIIREQRQLYGSSFGLDLHGLASGIYIFTMYDGNEGIGTGKISVR